MGWGIVRFQQGETSGARSSRLEAVLCSTEMDLADREAEDIDADLVEELESTYGIDIAGAAGLDHGGDLDGVRPAGHEEDAHDGAAEVLAQSLADMPPDEALDAALDPALAPVEPPACPPPPEPWQEVSDPGSSGYCYYKGRQAIRIQRGKPNANSVSISCYRHTSCTMLLSASRCPPDSTLKQWLFEVEATPAGASDELKAALRRRHMQLGKDRWSAAAEKQRLSRGDEVGMKIKYEFPQPHVQPHPPATANHARPTPHSSLCPLICHSHH